MKQVLIGSTKSAPTASNPYNSIAGGKGSWGSNIFYMSMIATKGNLQKFAASIDTAPGSNGSYTFTVVNSDGDETNLKVAIKGTSTKGRDLAHRADVDAGTIIGIKCDISGTPNTTGYVYWTITFETDDPTECILFSAVASVAGQDPTYAPLQSDGVNSGSPTIQHSIASVAGILKKLYIALSKSPGTAPDAYTITVRKNGADTILTCTITAPDTTGNDLTDEVSVDAGDTFNISITKVSAPANLVGARIGLVFTPSDTTKSILMGNTDKNYSASDDEYNLLLSGRSSQSWSTAVADCDQLCGPAILSNLYVETTVAPGVDKAVTFVVTKNGNETPLSVTISGTDLIGSDTSDTVSVQAFDRLALKCKPQNSPAVSGNGTAWGIAIQARPWWAGNIHIDQLIYQHCERMER